MSTATQTPGQHITIGTLFVPPGKKQTVEAFDIVDRATYVLVAYFARNGANVCRIEKDEAVATFGIAA